MKKHKLKLLCGITAAALFFLIFRSKETSDAISGALRLCGSTLIPALFPYLILSAFFVRSGCSAALSHKLHFLERFFGLGTNTAGAILLGSVCGYPAGARAVCDLYKDGQIDRHDANRLLSFACNASPAFFFAVVGGTYYRPVIGITLFLIHISAGTLCGLLTTEQKSSTIKCTNKPTPTTVTSALVESIAESGITMLQICFYVTAFSLPQSLLQRSLQSVPVVSAVLAGIIELSAGIATLSATPILWQVKFALNAFFLGFGGLCITMQTVAFLSKSDLSIKSYILGKLRHGLLSAIIAYPISFLLSPAAPVLSQDVAYKPISPWPWTLLPIGMIFLTFLQFPSRNSTLSAV